MILLKVVLIGGLVSAAVLAYRRHRRPVPGADRGALALCPRAVGRTGEQLMKRPRIALLSNPKSTGNIAQLPRIRAFCAEHVDIFH